MAAELWKTDLANGQSKRLVPGYGVEGSVETKNYAISNDGRQIVFSMKDDKGISHLWIAPVDRRSSPQRLESRDSEDSPFFVPDGDLIYRLSRGGINYLYTRKQDGSGEKKVMEEPILNFLALSPDGKWVMVGKSEDEDEDRTPQVVAYPLGGGARVPLCRAICTGGWDLSGTHMYLELLSRGEDKTYFLALENGHGLPKLPAGGVASGEELGALVKANVVSDWVESAMTPESYSYTRTNIRRNLYRIPIQ
jgi:hypothetical protein